MFEQSIIPSGNTNKPWTVVAAFLGQMLAVGILLLIPLLYVQALPPTELTSYLTLPLPPPPPPPPPPPEIHAVIHKVAPRQFNPKALIAPIVIPKNVPQIVDAPVIAENSVVAGIPGGIPGGQAGGFSGGILNSIPAPAPPPPPVEPAAPPPAPTPQRIDVGGQVQAARLIREIPPTYPPLARQARVAGTVDLKAIIAKDGSVKKLRVISGHPFLVPAAMSAVEHWLYKPTYLNGNPVEVSTEITVHFRLS